MKIIIHRSDVRIQRVGLVEVFVFCFDFIGDRGGGGTTPSALVVPVSSSIPLPISVKCSF